MALAGISTLGITVSYGVEATAGVKPTTFTELTRVYEVGEVSTTPEALDATSLSDFTSKFISGLTSVSDTMNVSFNLTDDTQAEWEAVITAQESAKTEGKRVWYQIASPYLKDAFFTVAEAPTLIPQPSLSVNGVYQCTMPLTVNEFVGLDTKVEVGE